MDTHNWTLKLTFRDSGESEINSWSCCHFHLRKFCISLSYLSANGVLHHALHWLYKPFHGTRLNIVYVHKKTPAFLTPLLVFILTSLFSQNLVRKCIAHRKLAGAFSIKVDFFLSMARQPPVRQGHLIVAASPWHSRHTTFSRPPLDKRSARQRHLTWQHTTLTRDRDPCPRRDSNPQSHQASCRRPTP